MYTFTISRAVQRGYVSPLYALNSAYGYRGVLQKVSLDAYRALRVRDYGRVDLRLTDTGDIYVIEVNANCYLEQESEFATAAAAADLDYPGMINRLADLAVERHKIGA